MPFDRLLRSLACCLLLSLCLPIENRGNAQELDAPVENEAIEETDAEIRRSKRQLESLERRASHVERRIELLAEFRKMVRDLVKTEEEVEQAESRDESETEEFEEKAWKLELAI